MMAGVEGNGAHGVEQHRIERVEIIHAGEDINDVIRPLAVILEEHLKLGEDVGYRRYYKPGTDVANHIAELISTGSEDIGVVLIVSERLNDVISKNPAAQDKIGTTLSRERPDLKVALVSIEGASLPSFKPSISLSSYTKLDAGALAEAIYKQWLGPEAQLTSQAEMSRVDLVDSNAAQDNYAPFKVKIIHAMQDPATKTHMRCLADAIDEVVDPEETTSCRIKFMANKSMAQTVLGDLKCFQSCSRAPRKVHALFVWCKFMLNALEQDQEAKDSVVDIVCRDISHQKQFAHFPIGVTRQEISRFSQVLSEFLTKHGHMVIFESFNCDRPVDYKPFASTFQRIWAGSIKIPKDPEESLDPTMNSLESLESLPPPLTSQKPEPCTRQSNTGDRLVVNSGSISHSGAVRTRQMGKVLAADGATFPSQERMVTSNGSFDPQQEKVMNHCREVQPDGHSNQPKDWSNHHIVDGGSFMEDPSSTNQEAVPVRQPTHNVGGKNRMVIGSYSNSVKTLTGPKTTNLPVLPTSSESSDRSAYSLPPSGGQQPCPRVPGEQNGKSKVAPSGFQSWSTCGSSPRPDSRQGGEDHQLAASGAGLSDLGVPASNSLRQGDNLSVGANPVRIVSENSDVLTSADGHELDNALQTLSLTSHGACHPLRSDFPTLTNSDITGSASVGQSERSGTLTMPPQSDVSDWTCRQSDGSQSVPYMPSERTDRVLSAPEGRNPMQDVPSSMCGSVSLPYPGTGGATNNAAHNRLPSVNGTNSVQSQAGSGIRQAVGQQPIGQLMAGDTLLSDLSPPIIRGLKIRLDPPKQTVADWQDLASNFGVSNVLITYWKGQKSDSSPFEQLLTWIKTEKQHQTVNDLKDRLEKVKRRDVLRFLEKEGF